MNNRREFLLAVGAAAFATPFSSFAQPQGKIWRVGFLAFRSRPDSLDSDVFGAFRQGMRELGYVEGKNLEIQWRYAESKSERLPDLAAELVQMKVDVIVAVGAVAITAVQKANTTIPIVMGSVTDPVGHGFVNSLAHPGGNITGLSDISEDISPKHLEMLLSIVPKLSRVAVLRNPANTTIPAMLKSIQAAGQKVSVKILSVDAQTSLEIEKAFSAMTREKAGAVIVSPDPFFIQQRRQIAALMVKHRLPSISARATYPEAGGLIGYGPSSTEKYRRAATYVDKIFKGANPGDLPVEQPTKFELVINMKTAKALGIKIPQSLLISANKVID